MIYLSVAKDNLAMVRSSWLPAALMLVRGVFVLLPLTDAEGVPEVEVSPFFKAFSARRFCLDAEGAMVVVSSQGGSSICALPANIEI